MIRGLDDFIRERRLLQTCPLTALKDTRLGIDLELYLNTLLKHTRTAEPFVAALGGAPTALISHIEDDLKILERNRIKPVFVLSGITPAAIQPKPSHSPSTPAAPNNNNNNKRQNARQQQQQQQQQQQSTHILPLDPRVDQRTNAWDAYERGDVHIAQSLFAHSDSVRIQDLIRALVSLERHSKSYVHAVYADNEVFLFDRVDRIILSLDLVKGVFTYASKIAIMAALGANEESFLDAALLAGFSACQTFPPLLDAGLPPNPTPALALAPEAPPGSSGPNGTPNLKQIADIVRHYRSGYTICVVFAEHPLVKATEYTEHFCRARCMIKFSLVLHAEEGRVLPLPVATPPPPLPVLASAPSGAGLLTPSASSTTITSSTAVNTASATPTSSSTTTTTTTGVVAPGVNGMTPAVPGSSSNLHGTTTGPPILTASDVPKDLSDIFTFRLPDEVFLHLGRGMLSPTLLEYLTRGRIHESAPLDGGESVEYRTFVREVVTEGQMAPRCVAVALACSALHPFWHTRKVVATYWFLKSHNNNNNNNQSSSQGQGGQYAREINVPHESKVTQDLISRVKAWNVPGSLIEEELRRQNSSTIDLALCLGATISDPLAARTRTPRPSPGSKEAAWHPLEKKDEIVANVIWRTLELRGFLNHNHCHTPYARALHLALKQSRVNDKLQEPLFLALELIRAGVLHSGTYSGRAHTGGPSMGSEGEKKHVLLIMRAFSMVPLSYKPALSWDAPLSRELLVFNSFLKVLGRSMRHLVEMVACTLLLRGDARRARDDFLDIALSLPFGTDANTALGIVVKCYLEGLLTMHDGRAISEEEVKGAGREEVREEKEAIVEMLGETFENVKDVKGELRRGFRFWDVLMVAVRTLNTEKAVSAELAQQFEKANAWLAPMAVP
ncbi:unnamed protein product [Tilletia caries]|nr:unnamed protein product [Tilletia caries]